jgi:hypothetical protein
MTKNSDLERILESLRHNRDLHSFSHISYPSLKRELASIFKKHMGPGGSQEIELPGIGHIKLPYFEMGSIDSNYYSFIYTKMQPQLIARLLISVETLDFIQLFGRSWVQTSLVTNLIRYTFPRW